MHGEPAYLLPDAHNPSACRLILRHAAVYALHSKALLTGLPRMPTGICYLQISRSRLTLLQSAPALLRSMALIWEMNCRVLGKNNENLGKIILVMAKCLSKGKAGKEGLVDEPTWQRMLVLLQQMNSSLPSQVLSWQRPLCSQPFLLMYSPPAQAYKFIFEIALELTWP